MKHRICSVARVMACASFLALAIIGVSSLVRAMSLESIASEKGVPAIWDVVTLGSPESITVPVDYWDQRQDSCDAENRQFEWVICGYWTKGALQGVVKDQLGTDGLPVPTFTNSTDAWNANRDVFTMNVTGHDPVQSGDNFYRWFHEVEGLSKHYSGEVTFHKIESEASSNVYAFGRDGTFPLDDVDFSDDDEATAKGHNYHFSSHLSIPIKVAADGKEKFEFSGDDDVWVFLNNQLVLDIGGLHEKLNGSFTINTDGTLTTYVQNVNDVSGRASLGEPSNDFDGYVDPLNNYNIAHFKDITKTIDLGLKSGDVVSLDVFYAERSTTESNVHITLTSMNWPITADSDVKAKVVGRVEGSENNLVQFNTSITNRDPERPLDLERLAAFIRETTADETREGYLPLDSSTLEYTKTPRDPDSWQSIEITAPANTTEGFNFVTPLRLTPYGQAGDTIYFRYFGETSSNSGSITSLVSYYTTLDGEAGFTYDSDTVTYAPDPTAPSPVTPTTPTEPTNPTTPTEPTTPVDPTDPITPVDPPIPTTPTDPTNPIDPIDPTTPTDPDQPSQPNQPLFPGSDIFDDPLDYTPPLGEVAFVPNTGLVSDLVAPIFEQYFASAILSQTTILLLLFIFAGSFATYFSLRRYLNFTINPAAATRSAAKSMQKSSAKSATKTAKSTAKTIKTAKSTRKPVTTIKNLKSTARTSTKSNKR